MPGKIRQEVALAFGAVVAALEAVNATVLHPPTWVHVVVAVLIALGGALGVRRNVRPA